MGYKADRFIDQSVLDPFKCVVCRDVLRNAKQLSCEDFCCETCLGNENNFQCPKCMKFVNLQQVEAPPRVFFSFYETVRIRCSFEECDFVCTMGQIDQHEESCQFNPKNILYCEKFCGIQLTNDTIKTHSCGEYFLSRIAKLNQRIEELENEVETLKQNKTNSHSIGSMSKWNYSSTSRLDLSGTDIKHHFTAMGKSLRNMIQKFNRFEDPRIFNPSSEWTNDSLYKLFDTLVTNNDLKQLINSLDIRALYDNKEFKATISKPFSNRSLKLLLTLLVLEYLLNEGELRDKKILLLGIVDYCVLPYFAHFAKKVVTNTSEGTKNWYEGLLLDKLPTLAQKTIFEPYFSNNEGFIRKNREEFDVIVALDRYLPQETKQFLESCCRNGFMILINKSKCFDRRYLKARPNGGYDQQFKILETADNVKNILDNRH